MVANAGAGPEPIPSRELNSQILAQGISYCLTQEARAAAQSIANKMRSENGVVTAVQSWLRQLPAKRLQCDLIPDQPAVWNCSRFKKTLKLSKLAAAMLTSRKLVDDKHLQM